MRFPKVSQYPKKVYAGNEAYSIIFCKKLQIYGETDPVKKVIRIKHGMSPRETFSTIIHELLHLAEFEHNIKLKHKTVYKLEKAIVEILLDNFL